MLDSKHGVADTSDCQRNVVSNVVASHVESAFVMNLRKEIGGRTNQISALEVWPVNKDLSYCGADGVGLCHRFTLVDSHILKEAISLIVALVTCIETYQSVVGMNGSIERGDERELKQSVADDVAP